MMPSSSPSTISGRSLQGSSGWGDAVVLVPWELRRTSGDTEVSSALPPAMVKWIDYVVRVLARTRRHPSLEAERPACRRARGVPLGWRLPSRGQWLEPGADIVDSLSREQESLATAYLYRPRRNMGGAHLGGMLGHSEEAKRLDSLATHRPRARTPARIRRGGWKALSRHAGESCSSARARSFCSVYIALRTADGLCSWCE